MQYPPYPITRTRMLQYAIGWLDLHITTHAAWERHAIGEFGHEANLHPRTILSKIITRILLHPFAGRYGLRSSEPCQLFFQLACSAWTEGGHFSCEAVANSRDHQRVQWLHASFHLDLLLYKYAFRPWGGFIPKRGIFPVLSGPSPASAESPSLGTKAENPTNLPQVRSAVGTLRKLRTGLIY